MQRVVFLNRDYERRFCAAADRVSNLAGGKYVFLYDGYYLLAVDGHGHMKPIHSVGE